MRSLVFSYLYGQNIKLDYSIIKTKTFMKKKNLRIIKNTKGSTQIEQQYCDIQSTCTELTTL
jgi:hypothetical protein